MFDNCQIYDRTFCQEYFDKLAKWVQYNKCPEMSGQLYVSETSLLLQPSRITRVATVRIVKNIIRYMSNYDDQYYQRLAITQSAFFKLQAINCVNG